MPTIMYIYITVHLSQRLKSRVAPPYLERDGPDIVAVHEEGHDAICVLRAEVNDPTRVHASASALRPVLTWGSGGIKHFQKP